MGVLYSLLPLNDELAAELNEGAALVPEARGRDPKPAEILAVVSSLEGFRAQEQLSLFGWDLRIEGTEDPRHQPRTLIHSGSFVDHDTPARVRFEKGWPSLILRIVRALAAECGPLVVDPNTGCGPCLVEAESDIEELLADWGHQPSWLPGHAA